MALTVLAVSCGYVHATRAKTMVVTEISMQDGILLDMAAGAADGQHSVALPGQMWYLPDHL